MIGRAAEADRKSENGLGRSATSIERASRFCRTPLARSARFPLLHMSNFRVFMLEFRAKKEISCAGFESYAFRCRMLSFGK